MLKPSVLNYGMSSLSEDGTTLSVYVTINDDEDVRAFVPGSVVFLGVQVGDDRVIVPFSGDAAPVASLSDEGEGMTPFGVVAASQVNVNQTLAAYKIYLLKVGVSGVVRTLVPFSMVRGEVRTAASTKTGRSYVLGRGVGQHRHFVSVRYGPGSDLIRTAPGGGRAFSLPKHGDLCWTVALNPCLSQ
jgi:hypothetical protein